MLVIRSLHATLNTESDETLPILRGIDLTVNPGEVHVILGPNGSGKSTLGRVLLGDERYEIEADELVFNGEDFTELEPAERAQAGFFLSFQAPPELDGVSAKDLLFAAKKSIDQNFSSSFRFKKSLHQTLEQMRLSADFSTREMNKGASGGERRKMEMVSLLTLDPQLAFLDEIDSGIDVDAMRAVADGINAFTSNPDKAVILISHTEKLLNMISPTHVHILVKGQVVKSGGPELVGYVHDQGFDEWLASQKPSGLRVVS